jgi:hypothetical protein
VAEDDTRDTTFLIPARLTRRHTGAAVTRPSMRG